MLLSHHIAIWDVIDSCDIIGSSDSSIKNVIPANLNTVIKNSRITKVYANGKTAERLYHQYCEVSTTMQITVLPSTSPANAAYSVDKLISYWKIIVSFQ